jgi:hypothetical protein
MMGWNIISLARGIYNANGYWEWKVLIFSYLFTIIVPLSIVIGLRYEMALRTIGFVLSYVLILSFFLVSSTLSYDSELYSRAAAIVPLVILFIPYLTWRLRLLVLIVALFSLGLDPSYRVNLIRIVLSLMVLILSYSRLINYKYFLNIISGSLFLLPLTLLYLGATDHFNVFADLKELVSTGASISVSEGGESRESSLDSDTRTFLYIDVFNSMVNHNSSFIIGEGGGAGYESVRFKDVEKTDKGRFGCEVGFLNTLLYSGVIGVSLYASMIMISVYYAINRSKNKLCKMLALFILSKWVIFFIEDIPKLDMNNYFIWLVAGLCLSPQFRSLTDRQLSSAFSNK